MTELPVWGAPEWGTAAIALFVAGGLALAWCYWFAPPRGATRLVAAVLKLVGLGLLAVFLVEPLLTGTRPRTGANLFAMVVDDSQSLSIHEPSDDASRGEQLQRTLLGESSWQTRLERDFDLRRFAFDSQLRGIKDFGELRFEGDSTSVGATLAALAQRLRGLPAGGALLFTDGNSTDLLPPDLAWEELPPIYPVVIGSQRTPRDVSVEQVSTSHTNFDAAPVTIRATVRALGPGERTVVVHLKDESGKELESQTIALPAGEETASVQFELRPTQAGVSFYDVHAALAEGDPNAEEATLANNARKFVVDRGAGPYRVLYVCGRPNWDFKFLRRAMEGDDQIELVGLIRISNREPRFTFRRRGDRGTNQLFDGFDHEDAETAEQYDEPVLARLGTRDDEELRDGFPDTTGELYQYDAIVLDDLESDFFSQDQMSLVEKFVSRRGGGLLMLSGAGAFAEGGYQRTPIGNLLPVYLDRIDRPTPATPQEYRLGLTREGWLQPWVRLRPTEEEDRQRLAGMPAFRILNDVGYLKPGATELAHVIDSAGQERPALVAQRYGRGRTAALLIGDLWRWGMRQEDPANDDLERSWRQTVRWLVADVPQRVEVEVRPSPHQSASAMQLAIRATDQEFLPLDNAMVQVEVIGPTGSSFALRGAAEDLPGDYTATHVSRTPGAYRATVEVTAPDGSLVGTRQTGWVVQPLADEFPRLQPNRELLEQIASRSGGEVLEPRNLPGFVSSLQSREMPLTEPWVRPLWHHPLVFLLAIACLTGEWGLRRWKGLA